MHFLHFLHFSGVKSTCDSILHEFNALRNDGRASVNNTGNRDIKDREKEWVDTTDKESLVLPKKEFLLLYKLAHKHGLVLDYSLENNMVLQRYWQPEFQKGGFIQSDKVREYSDKLIAQYDVRSGQGSSTIVRSMSGGNQQKAIIAREIDKDPKLLVAVQQIGRASCRERV